MLGLKLGVNLDGLKPQTLLAMIVVNQVYSSNKFACTITSCNDGKHSVSSLHYLGRAFDVRTKNLQVWTRAQLDAVATLKLKETIVSMIKTQLGPQFDVLLEDLNTANEHIHVEWDPKTSKVAT